MALVELFDLEVERVRKDIMEEPGFLTGQIIATLEHEFLGLNRTPV